MVVVPESGTGDAIKRSSLPSINGGMSLPSLLLALSLIWLAIHGLRSLYLKKHGHGHADSSLQLSSAPFGSRTSYSGWRSKWGEIAAASQFHLKGVQMRVSTRAWNDAHDRLSDSFLKRRNQRLLHGLKVVYNVGVAAGVVGMVLGCGGILWIIARALSGFLKQSESVEDVGRLVKRYVEDVSEGVDKREEFGVKVIVRLSILLHNDGK